jgi:hypothetical protein
MSEPVRAVNTMALAIILAVMAAAQGAGTRNVAIEVYSQTDEARGAQAVAAVRDLEAARGGITLAVRDVTKDPAARDRLLMILGHFRVPPDTSPVIYCCNRVIHGANGVDGWTAEVRRALQFEVFVRAGCSRCAAVKQWLPSLIGDYPGLELVYRDLASDAASAARLSDLVARHRTRAVSVPVFHLCDTLVVGFDRAETTGEKLRSILKTWTHAAPENASRPGAETRARTGRASSASLEPLAVGFGYGRALLVQEPVPPPLPQDAGKDVPTLPVGVGPEGAGDESIEVPWLGRLTASNLGMPVFTFLVGLVDGVNPCAMWVLLFLLSILVNLQDRLRIVAIAGSFVVISGLAYFAFMAAWLNVFVLVGYLRPVQVVLAILAIVIGAVHVKDFFAFKRGISLSIPESARPRIYERVRRIVSAEHLLGAVLGATTLAVLVNFIELLCTSGLPALYTSILTQQGHGMAATYGYLALYVSAYMLDDTIMVTVVVLTLSKLKLQQSGGRWLKLVSGLAIVLLGAVMLLRPEWLQ